MFRFPWGDMHSLNLGWFLQKFNELREDWATAEAGIDGALDAEIEKAEDALSDVFAARDAAAASATAAAGSASSAGTSATAAGNSATAAASSATLANQKATAAGLSEAAAAQSATAAGNSATAAATSATQAGNSASNASSSATAAAASETAAGNSATAAAASETNAAASAAAAEAVEESIPADYSTLSHDVNNLNSAVTQSVATNYILDQYSDNIATNTSGTNKKIVKLQGNRITQTPDTATPAGSTFYTYLISKTPRYVGSSLGNVIANLTEDDFKSLDLFTECTLRVKYEYIARTATDDGSSGTGSVVIATRNPVTGEVTAVQTQVTNIYANDRSYSLIYDLYNWLPELKNNKTIAVLYQSRLCKTIQDGFITFEAIRPVANSIERTYIGQINNEVTANRAYSTNDVFMKDSRFYRATTNIGSGETLTVGTNITPVTLSDALTLLYNSN